ncbi:MAG: glycoside hydrolase family 97 protein [Acidobacteria bacterium]|nr:glycoside hydrolase family 97 protein [Acidobacteriota bacterium]
MSISLKRSAAGEFVYTVSYEGKVVLGDSPLGLSLKGEPALNHDLQVVTTKRSTYDQTWNPVAGPQKQVRNRYQEIEIALRESTGAKRRLDIILRAYDEGVALRYRIPEQPNLSSFVISAEQTGFAFPSDAEAYGLNIGKFVSPSEGEFAKIRLDDISPDSLFLLPLLVHPKNGPWIGLLEADLTDYAGLYLRGVDNRPHHLAAVLSPLPGRPGEAVVAKAPKLTPWRVLMIAPTAGELIEHNYLVRNLSRPSQVKDTSWIVPGKTSLFWWTGKYPYATDFVPGPNTATYKHFVDFSAEHHFEYALLDDGWSTHEDITQPVPTLDMDELVRYAKSKNVRLLLWAPWTAVNQQMDAAFPIYERWGVAGIKVDFMDRDDQEMVNFCERVSQKAAQHHLLVDFHGTYKPTGESRTYPNVLVREAVMGLEYSLWSKRTTPEHDVTIPFTRMLAGGLDYAPGSFLNATREQFQPRDNEPMAQGTRAHQLGLYVVFEAPLAMVWGYPEAYRNQPGMEFLEQVPTSWDETRVLQGAVGEFITVARRHGTDWYVGGLTNWDSRDISLAMDFLGTGEYTAKIFADGDDADKHATSLQVQQIPVTAQSSIPLRMAPGGGFVMILSRKN